MATEAYNLLGNIYSDQKKFSMAQKNYEKALQLNPSHLIARMNMAHNYRQWHQLSSAIEKLQEVILQDPNNGEAHFNLSYCYLMIGKYEDGWREYEWRWNQESRKSERHNLPQPQWRGEPLAGKKLLLHSEQGFGDIIMFSRFIAQIPSDGAEIILESRAPLLTILKSSFKNISQCILKGDFLPAVDFQIAIPSFPFALKNTLETLPMAVPYLQPNDVFIKKWVESFPKHRKKIF